MNKIIFCKKGVHCTHLGFITRTYGITVLPLSDRKRYSQTIIPWITQDKNGP